MNCEAKNMLDAQKIACLGVSLVVYCVSPMKRQGKLQWRGIGSGERVF